MINLSAFVLRIREQDWYDPGFRDPLYPVTQIIGGVGSLILLPLLGFVPLVFAIAVIIVGIIWSKTYGKGRAIPDYNLLDIIEEEEVVTSPADVHKRVMVPVSDPEIERDLLRLADCLGDDTIGLNVVDVPDQIGLTEAREKHVEQFDKDFQKIDKIFRNYFGSTEREQRYLIVFDHSISDAIVEQSEKEKADLILMGWQREARFSQGMGSITQKVMHQAKSHKAVLKGNYPEEIHDIALAYDGKKNSSYGLQLAHRISQSTGARIKLFHIVSPDASPREKENMERELKELVAEEDYPVSHELLERFSISDPILEIAEEADLTIIGDSIKRFSLSHIGNRAARIARNCDDNLLIVKRYQPFSKETVLSRFKKFTRRQEIDKDKKYQIPEDSD